MSKKDYYEVLEITRSASAPEIKKAYLKLAKKYHPDANGGDAESEKKFKEISEAYDVLKDEQKKAAYDRFGHDAFEGGSAGFGQQGGFSGAGAGRSDIFDDFFNNFMGGGNSRHTRSSQTKGSDLRYNVEISLEEAFTGVDKNISFTTEIKCTPCSGKGTTDTNANTTCPQCHGHGAVRMQQGFFAIEQTCGKCNGQGQIIKNPCNTCHGSGRYKKNKNLIVNIPAGVEDQMRIRVAGEGEAGFRGGQVGDLYVFVHIKTHEIFKVENSNLHFKLPLNFTKVALGGEVEVPTIEGGRIKLQVPAGTETGDKLRIRGRGMSKVRSTQRGDMYAHAFIRTPKNLTKRQKELLEELDNELGESNNNYKDEGFFTKMKNMWS